MELNVVWFILITILFTGFFLLEGFDYGVGILLPFLAKNDKQRRQVLNAIGPFWDGNEVWIITAGGAIFAAFPQWYATMFSGFYLALFLMLIALIVRAVGFEFRSKDESPIWRSFWDWMIFSGSLIPALLWGVALANLIRGLKIDGSMNYIGSFWDLLNPFALLGGIAFLALFVIHGALFLSLKTGDELEIRAKSIADQAWIPAAILVSILTIGGYFTTGAFERLGIFTAVIPLGSGLALLASGWFLRQERNGWAFIMTGAAIILMTITLFMGLYPNVMPSSLNPDWNLTIYNAASGQYTLRVMTIIAVIFVPVVIAYQAWSYTIFKKRIGQETHLEY
ncbi:MAG: cytochrome d ubiquinol oxidase subunit II [Anaerolineales bacterium]|nr:cytochrome d ubiquinol oxidase subunit II [Anaerolineales bacterium]